VSNGGPFSRAVLSIRQPRLSGRLRVAAFAGWGLLVRAYAGLLRPWGIFAKRTGVLIRLQGSLRGFGVQALRDQQSTGITALHPAPARTEADVGSSVKPRRLRSAQI